MAETSHPWTTPQQPESLLHMELATLSQKKPPQIVNYGEHPVKHEGRDPKECVSTRWHKDTEMPPQKKVPVGGALSAQIPPGAAAGTVPFWFLPWARR